MPTLDVPSDPPPGAARSGEAPASSAAESDEPGARALLGKLSRVAAPPDLVSRVPALIQRRSAGRFFAKRQLVTLFSAPNYCGEFDNAGAMMSVDESLMCSFQVRPRQSFWR